jgi:propionate CoA-transferase
MYDKTVTAAEAAAKIPDHAFVAVGGVNTAGTPMEVMDAIVDRFKSEGHPKGIDLTNSGNNWYTKQFAVEGLLGVYYAGFPSMDYKSEDGGLTDNNKIPVFHFTQGIGTQMYLAQAAGTPYLTKVGLGTYIDPRIDGACANEKAREFLKEHPVVKIVEIDGEEYLHFDLPPVTVALIRATIADTDGNLSDRDEAIKNEILPLAMAAHNNGGVVIAQVSTIVEPGQLQAAEVKVPGMLVDYIVKCTDQEKWAPQNLAMLFGDAKEYNPGLTGYCNIAREQVPLESWKPQGTKMMMARRGAVELWPGCVANVGLGIPTGIPYVLTAEGAHDRYYQTIELGAIGGYTGSGWYFSGAFNASAFLNHHEMFAFIDGKGLDITFLGASEVGEDGSVNVTRIAGKTNGSGGFVNISSNTKKIVFMFSHTAGGKAEIDDGKLRVTKPGRPLKFVKNVEQIAFNGREAAKRGQEVLYMTERAVFKLIDGRMTLIEYAPGLDIEEDIIAAMGFRPAISPELTPIPAFCFNEEKIGIKEKWERIVAEERQAP